MVLVPKVNDIRQMFSSNEDDDESGSLSPDLCAADRAIDFSGFNFRLDNAEDALCLADELANFQFSPEHQDSSYEDDSTDNDRQNAPLTEADNANKRQKGDTVDRHNSEAITDRFDRACRVVRRSVSLRAHHSNRRNDTGNSFTDAVSAKPETKRFPPSAAGRLTCDLWDSSRDDCGETGQNKPEVVCCRVSTSLHHLPDVVRDLSITRPSRPPDLANKNTDVIVSDVKVLLEDTQVAAGNTCQSEPIVCLSPGDCGPGHVITSGRHDGVNQHEDDGSYLDTCSSTLMNWDYLEEQLSRAIEREKQVDLRRQQRTADREEILRRLVEHNDDVEADTETAIDLTDRGRTWLTPTSPQRPGTSAITAVGIPYGYRGTPRRAGQNASATAPSSGGVCAMTPTAGGAAGSASNLQLCYVNLQYASVGTDLDVIANNDDVTANQLVSSPTRHRSPSYSSSSTGTLNTVTSSNSAHSDASSAVISSTVLHGRDMTSSMTTPVQDFLAVQARLQAEARLALAQVRPMAKMQLQLEKQSRKDAVTVDSTQFSGIGWLRDRSMSDRCRLLQPMCIGQLFTVINASIAAIKSLNADLMDLLVQRDTLHIVQDSLLVDIEDLTRRGLEYEVKGQKST